LALDIYKVIQEYKAMPHFHEMVNKWAENREAEIDKLKTWNEQRRLHFEQTVARHPRLQDQKAGPPQQGWQFENYIQHTEEKTQPGSQPSHNIIHGWVPLELSNSIKPEIMQLFPLRREHKFTLIEKYTVLAAVYDYGRKGTEELPPWQWPDLNLDQSEQALSDAKKCLFFEGLCDNASKLNPNDEGWLRALLDDIEKDVSNQENPAETDQGADNTICKGEEAWLKFQEKLSQFGSLEIPLYPFKAGKIKYWNLTGTPDICKYGAYRFSKKDSAIIDNTVGSTLNVSTLRAYLSAECNVQNPDNYSWKDILAALEHKLKTKTMSEMEQASKHTKSEQEGMIVPKTPEFVQNLLWYRKYGLKYWKLILIGVIILGIPALCRQFGIHNKIFDLFKNKPSISVDYRRTQLYARTKKRVDDFYESIRNEKLDPWLFINAGVEVRVTKHNGDVINPSGVLFTGSPRLVFWSDDFIPPFIEDAIIKVFDQTIDECRKNGLDPEIYIYEANRILGDFIYKIYNRMADMDQKLMKQAHSENFGHRDVSREIEKMSKRLDEQYNAALLLASGNENAK